MVGAKKGVKRGSSVTLSEMAGLTFPVARIASALKKNDRFAPSVSPTGAVFLTAAMQYVVTEILILAKKESATSQITPEAINTAVFQDEDLKLLLANVTIEGSKGKKEPKAKTAPASKGKGKSKSKASKKPVQSPSKKAAEKRVKCLTRTSIHRMLTELLERHSPVTPRVSALAISAVHTAAEEYLVDVLKGAHRLQQHRRKSTLIQKDISYAVRVREMMW